VVAEDTIDESGEVKRRSRRSICLVSSMTQSRDTEKKSYKHNLWYSSPPSGVRAAPDIAQSRESWTYNSDRREHEWELKAMWKTRSEQGSKTLSKLKQPW
jgi:hypothetical protein